MADSRDDELDDGALNSIVGGTGAATAAKPKPDDWTHIADAMQTAEHIGHTIASHEPVKGPGHGAEPIGEPKLGHGIEPIGEPKLGHPHEPIGEPKLGHGIGPILEPKLGHPHEPVGEPKSVHGGDLGHEPKHGHPHEPVGEPKFGVVGIHDPKDAGHGKSDLETFIKDKITATESLLHASEGKQGHEGGAHAKGSTDALSKAEAELEAFKKDEQSAASKQTAMGSNLLHPTTDASKPHEPVNKMHSIP